MSVGYGVDTWCLDSIVTGRLASGVQLVVQALYGRLTTPQGTLQGYDDEHNAEESIYGFDVSGYVGATGPDTAAAALPGLVENQLSLDDRVQNVAVVATIAMLQDGIGVKLRVTAVLRDSGEDFAFTLSASAERLLLTGIE